VHHRAARLHVGPVQIAGINVTNQPPLAAIMAGVAHIPEDRNRVGSSPNLTITDNVIMKRYRSAPSATA
jgi:ABC-type sugar transport system ATPase subunit